MRSNCGAAHADPGHRHRAAQRPEAEQQAAVGMATARGDDDFVQRQVAFRHLGNQLAGGADIAQRP